MIANQSNKSWHMNKLRRVIVCLTGLQISGKVSRTDLLMLGNNKWVLWRNWRDFAYVVGHLRKIKSKKTKIDKRRHSIEGLQLVLPTEVSQNNHFPASA